MAEAVIVSIIQKLDSTWIVTPAFDKDAKEAVEGIINDLRTILNLLREKKLEEGSNLNYFLCDVVEMVLSALTPDAWRLTYVRNCIAKAKMRVLESGVDGAEMRSENVGEGDGSEDVVGLEEEVEALLYTHRGICDEEQGLKTTFITGIVGSGKTSLARQLYNHPAVIDGFKRRAWLCLSGDLTNKEVLMKLVQEVVDCEQLQRDSFMEHADNASLQQDASPTPPRNSIFHSS